MNAAAFLFAVVASLLLWLSAYPLLGLVALGLKAGLFVACIYLPVALVRILLNRRNYYGD